MVTLLVLLALVSFDGRLGLYAVTVVLLWKLLRYAARIWSDGV